MLESILIRSVLLAVPLALLAFALLPLRWPFKVILAPLAGWLAALLVVTALPEGILSYLVSFAVMGSIYAVLTLGLNVQWGYTGLFNIGIAGFFALGAFTAALFTTSMPTGMLALFSHQAFGLEQPFLVGVIAAGLVAGVLAVLVGLPTLKLRHDYLAIATIGIAELVRLVFQNERWLANGPQPLRGIPRPLFCLVDGPDCPWLPAFLHPVFAALSPKDYDFIYVAIVTVILAAILGALQLMLRSPWGRVLRAVRDDEEAAAMSGKNVFMFKLQAFVVGAVVMGMGGALYAHHLVAIDHEHFIPLHGTFLIWVMLMLGGSGNARGALLGAFVIWGVWSGTAFLTDLLTPALAAISHDLPARAPHLRFLFIAVLLILILLYRPRGLIAEERVVSRV